MKASEALNDYGDELSAHTRETPNPGPRQAAIMLPGDSLGRPTASLTLRRFSRSPPPAGVCPAGLSLPSCAGSPRPRLQKPNWPTSQGLKAWRHRPQAKKANDEARKPLLRKETGPASLAQALLGWGPGVKPPRRRGAPALLRPITGIAGGAATTLPGRHAAASLWKLPARRERAARAGRPLAPSPASAPLLPCAWAPSVLEGERGRWLRTLPELRQKLCANEETGARLLRRFVAARLIMCPAAESSQRPLAWGSALYARADSLGVMTASPLTASLPLAALPSPMACTALEAHLAMPWAPAPPTPASCK